MDNRWNDIATAAYGLTDLRLTESRAHFSNHFFIESSQGQFVLSCSPFQADRMVKSYQFQLMEVLKYNGFRQVSLPREDGVVAENCGLGLAESHCSVTVVL